MNIFVVLAVALAMDAFAVSIGVSLMHKGLTRGQTFRLSSHFGLFQFIMPLLGWAAGRNILNILKPLTIGWQRGFSFLSAAG